METPSNYLEGAQGVHWEGIQGELLSLSSRL